jgi:2-dehydropantoate 2-reductase
VVFLCVKSQDTEGVVLDLYSLVKDVPIFCLQNGVRNEEIVSNYYNRVYGVSIVGGGIFVHDGEVISRDDPPARLLVGCYPEGTDELVESVAANLRNAGYEVVVTPEVMPYKWGKLIINLTNAIGAITNTAGDETKIIASAVQKEAEEILAQAEIRCIATKEPSIRRQVSIIEPSKDPFGMSLGSTWQSLIRRQGSVETEFLNGEIVRQAKKLGKQAPINEMLLHITNEMAMNHESPGKYTPAELAKILKLN